MIKSDFNIQLQGFTPANREALVTLKNQATGEEIQRKPFADGSLLVRDVDPGLWELTVTHPNLTMPIDRRTIRLFPQDHIPTFVPVPVPADLFRDTPIRDIPDRDLTPIQQAATAVRDRLRPIGVKGAGEAIRAADFNAMVSSLTDLAAAMLQLVDSVSPKGHDHPEIAEKIAEVNGNLRRFAEAYGQSLLELRRELETVHLRLNALEVLENAQAPEPVKLQILDKVKDLEANLQADTTTFTQKLAATGSVVLTQVNEIAAAKGADADNFLAQPAVKALQDTARNYFDAGTLTKPEAELNIYRRTSTATGSKFGNVIKGGVGLNGARPE